MQSGLFHLIITYSKADANWAFFLASLSLSPRSIYLSIYLVGYMLSAPDCKSRCEGSLILAIKHGGSQIVG